MGAWTSSSILPSGREHTHTPTRHAQAHCPPHESTPPSKLEHTALQTRAPDQSTGPEHRARGPDWSTHSATTQHAEPQTRAHMDTSAPLYARAAGGDLRGPNEQSSSSTRRRQLLQSVSFSHDRLSSKRHAMPQRIPLQCSPGPSPHIRPCGRTPR